MGSADDGDYLTSRLTSPINQRPPGGQINCGDFSLVADIDIADKPGNANTRSYTIESVVRQAGDRMIHASDIRDGEDQKFTVEGWLAPFRR